MITSATWFGHVLVWGHQNNRGLLKTVHQNYRGLLKTVLVFRVLLGLLPPRPSREEKQV